MGFNRRKMEEQRREAAEKEAATRRATDAQVLEDAERLIAAWNERQALRAPMIFSRHSSLSTNGRFNASMRNQPDDDELMNAMFLQLQIKVGVGEAAGAPMLLGYNFTWRRHEFGAELATPCAELQSAPCGTFSSSTIIVMIIAITPSLNAARRSLPMTLSLLVQTVRHYLGQQSNLATGAEGSRTLQGPRLMSALPPKADIG